jgi:hypothetical protein
MGEVYRATDTSLGRDVAIKVQPAQLAQDPERLARFERDPRRRLHDVADARIVLDELRSGRGETGPTAVAAGTPRLGLVAGGVLVLAALAVGTWLGRRTAGPAAIGPLDAGFHRFTRLTDVSGLESSPSLSPDSEFVAYVAIDGGDRDVLLLRVGGQRPINLTEDSAADEDHPAPSPDGKQIAFRSERAGGGLFVMGATGESTRRLTTFGDNPPWSPDGREIVFATEGESDPHAREKTSELWVVPATGGEPRTQPCSSRSVRPTGARWRSRRTTRWPASACATNRWRGRRWSGSRSTSTSADS